MDYLGILSKCKFQDTECVHSNKLMLLVVTFSSRFRVSWGFKGIYPRGQEMGHSRPMDLHVQRAVLSGGCKQFKETEARRCNMMRGTQVMKGCEWQVGFYSVGVGSHQSFTGQRYDQVFHLERICSFQRGFTWVLMTPVCHLGPCSQPCWVRNVWTFEEEQMCSADPAESNSLWCSNWIVWQNWRLSLFSPRLCFPHLTWALYS